MDSTTRSGTEGETETVVDAVVVPPGPVAVMTWVVVPPGQTTWLPGVPTPPMP
jgi:hypothetical protein